MRAQKGMGPEIRGKKIWGACCRQANARCTTQGRTSDRARMDGSSQPHQDKMCSNKKTGTKSQKLTRPK